MAAAGSAVGISDFLATVEDLTEEERKTIQRTLKEAGYSTVDRLRKYRNWKELLLPFHVECIEAALGKRS